MSIVFLLLILTGDKGSSFIFQHRLVVDFLYIFRMSIKIKMLYSKKIKFNSNALYNILIFKSYELYFH